MRQKLIQEVMFIFFIFVFSIVKSEGPKVKLVKVKEFSSYEEYERWRGIKPRRVRVEGDFVKFYDDKGKLIKEIRLEGYSERMKVFSDDSGVMLLKLLSDEEEERKEPIPYEIYDERGNLRTRILLDYDGGEVLYPAPNGSYFISVRPDEGGDVDNFWRVYGDDGRVLYEGKFLDEPAVALFGFRGIFFSDDSRYCLICVERGKDGFVVYDSSKNAMVWRVFRDWDILSGGIAFLRSGRGIIIPTQEGVYRFSVDGKQVWYNKETKLQILNSTVNCESPDGRDLAYYKYDVYILDLTNGNLIRNLELPDSEIEYTDEESIVVANKVKYLFVSRGGWKEYPDKPGAKKIKVMYLIDKRDGGIIWSRENVDEGLFDAELVSEDEFLVKEGGKWCLYKITEE